MSELNAILPTVCESKSRLTLLTCMEKLDRLGVRLQADTDRLRRDCDELRGVVREQGSELKTLRRRIRKDEESLKTCESRGSE